MISNNNWAKNERKRHDALAIMAETKKGKIEYMKKGEAPYLLVLTGSPGFCQDQCGVGYNSGFGLITVNRPGFGNTPLT